MAPDAARAVTVWSPSRTMTYWQIAAGSGGRDYYRDFLRYGLAFVGGKPQMDTLRQVALGDRLLLKRGLGQVLAAGVVVERNGKFVSPRRST